MGDGSKPNIRSDSGGILNSRLFITLAIWRTTVKVTLPCVSPAKIAAKQSLASFAVVSSLHGRRFRALRGADERRDGLAERFGEVELEVVGEDAAETADGEKLLLFGGGVSALRGLDERFDVALREREGESGLGRRSSATLRIDASCGPPC